jgi:thioredoxin-like negative regulator of GroEL
MLEYLYFSAKWCAPCRVLAPTMLEVSKTIPVKKSDIDENPQLASQWGIKSVPTVLALKDGVEIRRIIGVKPAGEYLTL